MLVVNFINLVGQGSWSIVVAAKDKESKDKDKNLAIKKIGNAFDYKNLTKRTLMELKLLRRLKH